MDAFDDRCVRPHFLPPQPTAPLAPAIYPAAVYRCEDTQQAEALMAKELPGYIYSREGHPNGDQLAERCADLHGAHLQGEQTCIICSSGMAALSTALLAFARQGDHVVVSNRLYGQSLNLLVNETARLGIASTVVDTNNLAATAAAFQSRTRLVVVETLSNPTLRVSDVPALAEMAHARGALLLVDNSFASPAMFRPLEHGADLVLESLTKQMNGHSDVLLGALCGSRPLWDRVPGVVSAWGFSAPPFDCWLALRGLGTLALRAERGAANAKRAAEFLSNAPRQQGLVEAVHYPGLPGHADYGLARQMFGDCFGSMVTFTLAGGRAAADAFIRAAQHIPFCPSLGDLCTTLSHPATTSHRRLSEADRAALGITGGTIRLSVGIESAAGVLAAIEQGLAGVNVVNVG